MQLENLSWAALQMHQDFSLKSVDQGVLFLLPGRDLC